MDKNEQLALTLGVFMITIFLIAILISSKALGMDVPECVNPEEAYTEGELVKLDEKLYQIKYVSKMWAFEPASVEIPVGSEVDIYLSSQDVVHGFYLRGKNLNIMAVPGTLGKSTVKFTKPGTYPIFCHEYCGTGHHFMKGEIVVTR